MHIPRIRAGDTSLSARSFNHMATAAEHVHRALNRISEARVPTIFHEHGIVTIKNVSDAHQAPLNILSLKNVLVTPDRNLDVFKNQHIFEADIPETGDTKLAILLDPIKKNEYGTALVDGITSIKIEISSTSHEYAEALNGDSSKLASCDAGIARILWSESGTGTKWAKIQFPFSTSGGSQFINALITAAEGNTPPFLYSAVESTLSSSGEISQKTGGRIFTANVRNVCETPSNHGVGKIPIGRPVRLWYEAGVYWFDQAWYRGSYG